MRGDASLRCPAGRGRLRAEPAGRHRRAPGRPAGVRAGGGGGDEPGRAPGPEQRGGERRRRRRPAERDVRRHRPAPLLRQSRQRRPSGGRLRRPGAGGAPGHGPGDPGRPAALQPGAPADPAQPGDERWRDGPERRLPLRAGRGLDRPDGRAQGRPVRQRLPHALPRRRPPGDQALLRGHGGVLRPPRPLLPPGDRRRRHRRHEGPVRHPRQGGGLPAPGRRPPPRPPGGRPRGGAARPREPHHAGDHGVPQRHPRAGRALRGGLHPHRRPAGGHQRAVPRRAPGDGPHLRRRPGGVPRGPAVVQRVRPAGGRRRRARRAPAFDQGRRGDEGHRRRPAGRAPRRPAGRPRDRTRDPLDRGRPRPGGAAGARGARRRSRRRRRRRSSGRRGSST